MSDNCMNHIENHWKKLTTLANDFYNKNEFEKALSDYQEALFRAEVLNDNISNCIRLKIPFVQIYIISCNNLTNTYEELHNHEEADKMLKQVIYFLLYMAKSEQLDLAEIQSELKSATLNYVSFSKRNDFFLPKEEVIIHILKDQLLENTSSKALI